MVRYSTVARSTKVPGFLMASRRRSPKRHRGVSKVVKPFEATALLANAGMRRTIHHYGRKEAIFSQGESADAVFYIQQGEGEALRSL
jgi:CRP-like cAMP-binding protein